MLTRLLANAAALAAATALLPGITLTGSSVGHKAVVIIVVACIFGALNALVKPVVKFFSFPLIIITFGLLLWVINAGMLLATSAIADRLGQPWQVDGWGSALLGSVVISVVSALVGGLVKGDEQ